jgi:phosphate transport system protein
MLDKAHTVKSYEEELNGLIRTIMEMGKMTTNLITLSEESLFHDSKDYIDEAIVRDKAINDCEDRIEKQATRLLALRQPMAFDLRLVTSAIKISSLLERMGDRAKNTIKKASRYKVTLNQDISTDLKSMNALVVKMVSDVLSNIQNYDYKTLKNAWNTDDQVDDYFSKLYEKLLENTEISQENINEFTASVSIIKNFERIGDYATKIAKIVYYIEEGKQTTNFEE